MMTYDEYLAAWARGHSFEPERMGRFLRSYLRLPYALARPLAGIDPNAVTVAGFCVAAVTLPVYATGAAFLAGLLVLVAGLLDQVDGAVAVLGGRQTRFGAVWDSAVDRLTDVVLLAGPAIWIDGGTTRWGLVAAGAGTFLLEYVRARCQACGWTDDQIVTPGERPQRVVAIALLGIVSALAGKWLWAVGAWALAGLTFWSVVVLLLDARARPTTPASA
ncbi:MAG TPA: CDP-alcohol phosphatidyltransferase family protein [Frankiaceae bacterium]|nr:CDP-alcohol phosphatidyltransferase family protein [Frankiaceae bacterium]